MNIDKPSQNETLPRSTGIHGSSGVVLSSFLPHLNSLVYYFSGLVMQGCAISKSHCASSSATPVSCQENTSCFLIGLHVTLNLFLPVQNLPGWTKYWPGVFSQSTLVVLLLRFIKKTFQLNRLKKIVITTQVMSTSQTVTHTVFVSYVNSTDCHTYNICIV